MWRDLRFALRSLVRQPVFTLVVVTTIAIGIGANTAIAGLLYALLAKPFAHGDADRLVRIESVSELTPGLVRGVSPPDVDDFRDESSSFTDLGAYEHRYDNLLLSDGRAHSVRATLVTVGVLRAFETRPALGRLFLEEEDRPGGDVFKAILGYGLWQGRFGGDPEILGRRIRTSVASYTVVGVMPRGFAQPGDTELWLPLQSWIASQDGGDAREQARGMRWYQGVGVVEPGLSIEAAEAELRSVAEELAERHPATNAELRPRLMRMRDADTRAFRAYLWLVFGTATFVLLIVCVNVASLLLARATAGSRELSLRMALGAGRSRLVRQVLVESALLAVAGGALGLVVAVGLLDVLPSIVPEGLPAWLALEVDLPILLWGLTLAAVTATLAGLAPAITAARVDVGTALNDGAKGSSSGRLRRVLVVAEVAVATLLLVGAGLLLRSFSNLLTVDPGFQPESVLTVTLTPQHTGTYREQTVSLSSFYRRVERRLLTIPQVVAVGGATRSPFQGDSSARSQGDIEIATDAGEESRHREPALVIDTTPGYFEGLGIPLLDGRSFNDGDTLESQKVVVVSQRTAERLFPGRSALGQQIRFAYSDPPDAWGTIVGIVGNVKYFASEANDGLELYYPISQYKAYRFRLAIGVRGSVDSAAPLVREAIEEAAPETAVADVAVMTDLIDDSLWQARLTGVLLASFAVAALFLAALGVYGVLSYIVSQTRREIGIRMALGAGASRIRGEVMGSGLRIVLVGAVVGVVAAGILGQALESVLFGVTPFDPLTFLVVPILLVAVACVACYLPGRRASSVDPIIALHQD